jgi:hypothetical protein
MSEQKRLKKCTTTDSEVNVGLMTGEIQISQLELQKLQFKLQN